MNKPACPFEALFFPVQRYSISLSEIKYAIASEFLSCTLRESHFDDFFVLFSIFFRTNVFFYSFYGSSCSTIPKPMCFM